MRFSIVLLALSPVVSVVRGAKGLYKQVFDERFTIYVDGCASSYFCSEDLTHPVNGLSWTNVHSVARITPFDQIYLHPQGQLPPFAKPVDPNPYLFGIYTGEAINASEPTIATSHYNGSCVKYWEVSSFALGCDIEYFNASDPTRNYVGPANCNITVEGFDGKGRCVGHEIYNYSNTPLEPTYLASWLEATYNTTKGGLKGKKLRSLRILANVAYDPQTQRNPELGIGRVQYTVFNSTKCS